MYILFPTNTLPGVYPLKIIFFKKVCRLNGILISFFFIKRINNQSTFAIFALLC